MKLTYYHTHLTHPNCDFYIRAISVLHFDKKRIKHTQYKFKFSIYSVLCAICLCAKVDNLEF